mmetsp:Transcript_16626/g.55880  ORF Transcript_16626/g.55880 Transcript_16626/m.55880 type:complete len:268 (+) Transcript_16626:969-1772(+)
MPPGNSRFCASLALATSLASRLPASSFAWSSSRRMPPITSRGSITLPSDLDILRPCLSRTMAWRYTSVKGSLSVMAREHMTMRATQKKRMSWPVSRRVVGCHPAFMSRASSSGHPRHEKGKRPEENHVSSTSSSRARRAAPESSSAPRPRASRASRSASASQRATMGSPSDTSSPSAPLRTTYHAGMRWPHQSCRDTHQSWMFSSHRYQVALWKSGRILSAPERTASTARAASVSQRTHHWGLSRGSITSPVREHTPRRMGLSASPR